MDFTQSFLQGVQQGQQRASQRKAQERADEEFDLKKQMLKVEMDKLKIAQAVAARKNAIDEAGARKNFDVQGGIGAGQSTGMPTLDFAASQVQGPQSTVPVQIPEGGNGEPAETWMAPTRTGTMQAEAAQAKAQQDAIEARSKVFVEGRGFIDKEIFMAEQQAKRDTARAAELDARLDRTDANVDKRIASQEKIAEARINAMGGGSELAQDSEEVDYLLTGGTVDKLFPAKIRPKAVEAAKARGGIDGTGFVPTSAAQQTKFSFLYGDALAKATRLKQLLEDPAVAAEMKNKLGPVKGRLIQATKEWSYVGQNTATKEAFDLFKDLSDTELRKRSGAAISPGEYDRIVGFTIDPTKQFDSNLTNLNRMIDKTTQELKIMGADRIGTAASKPAPDSPTSQSRPPLSSFQKNP